MYNKICERLAVQWCESLLALQIKNNDKYLNGGILCPACSAVHGRCMDALYPFLYMADKTKDKKWVDAAKLLFEWSEENVSLPNGGYRNGTNNIWSGITVFTVVQMCEALKYHGHVLDEDTKQKWKNRIRKAADFLMTFEPVYTHNVNYRFTNALAMQLCASLFEEPIYAQQGKKCAEDFKKYLSENMLIFGEGKPADGYTERGCRAFDLAYNIEESLPSLATYAKLVCDKELEQLVAKSMAAHLQFMLPDGAWDNSFCTRSFKWTYWGSRTSDGCVFAYTLLKDYDPSFITAAQRNLKLLEKCTINGLLAGGLHYDDIGEPCCVHHSFAHAKVLVNILNHNLCLNAKGDDLPRENLNPQVYFAEIDTRLMRSGKLHATHTFYDWEYLKGGHPSGGNISMLYHNDIGPLLCATMSEYSLFEPNNQQLPRHNHHECLSPRLEIEQDGIIYSTLYDYNAKCMVDDSENDETEICVQGELLDIDCKRNKAQQKIVHFSKYKLLNNMLIVSVETSDNNSTFICPLIIEKSDKLTYNDSELIIKKEQATVKLTVKKGILTLPYNENKVYNLVAGMQAIKTAILPDENFIEFVISVEIKDGAAY